MPVVPPSFDAGNVPAPTLPSTKYSLPANGGNPDREYWRSSLVVPGNSPAHSAPACVPHSQQYCCGSL